MTSPQTKRKSRPVGRPKLAKGEAKGKIVPVRFTADDIKCITAAARVSKLTVSQWIRERIEKDIHAG